MFTRRSVLTGTVLLLLSVPASAETFDGKVIGVTDGDSITVMRHGRATKIRLAEIDCPERRQAFGNRAKQFTSRMVFGRVVQVDVQTTDRYGRLVAAVLVDGRSLNAALVEAGLAWRYREYSKSKKLAALEATARSARRGLWRDPSPVPPWEFRRAGRTAKQRTRPPSSASPDKAVRGPIIGNRRSRIYHWRTCPGYSQVSPKNRALFATPAEAEQAGYRAARNCSRDGGD